MSQQMSANEMGRIHEINPSDAFGNADMERQPLQQFQWGRTNDSDNPGAFGNDALKDEHFPPLGSDDAVSAASKNLDAERRGKFHPAGNQPQFHMGQQEQQEQQQSQFPMGRTNEVDTSGALRSANAILGGIFGLGGAPTFSRGENLITIIKRDHQNAFKLADDYNREPKVERRREIARQLTKDLVQHSEVENLLVYPLLKMRSHDEAQRKQGLHDHSLQEHQAITQFLYDMDHTAIEDPLHSERLNSMIDLVRKHVQEEEEEVLPMIAKNYNTEELERLGTAFEMHKYAATTRPHPFAPSQGPLAAVANLIAKPIDMTKDALENLGSRVREREAERRAEVPAGGKGNFPG